MRENVLHTAGSFPRARKTRCTLQEAFRGLGKRAAHCRKLSEGSENVLPSAGSFQSPPKTRCRQRETFGALRKRAAVGGKLS